LLTQSEIVLWGIAKASTLSLAGYCKS